MKVTKFTILILLLASALFSLLNGCGLDGDDPEVMKVKFDTGLIIHAADQITGIKSHIDWIVVSNPFEIQIYDNKQNKLKALLTGHTGIVQTIALSEDSREDFFIAAGCSDGTIRIWDANELRKKIGNSNEILIFINENKEYYRDISSGHSGGVKTLTFSSKDSKLLASGGNDRNIKLWEVKKWWNDSNDSGESTIEPAHTHEEPEGSVSALTFSDDGVSFASGNSRGQIRMWEPHKDGNKKRFPGDEKENKIIALVFFSEDRYLVGAKSDSKIMVWDLEKTGPDEQDPIAQFVLDPEKAVPDEQDPIAESVPDDPGNVTVLAFLNHNSLLVAGTDKGNIYFWKTAEVESIETKKEILEVKYFNCLQKHYTSITALASLSEGTALASGSEDGTIYILTEGEILSLSEQ